MPYRAVKCKGYYNKINNAKISSAKIKSNINNLWRTTTKKKRGQLKDSWQALRSIMAMLRGR